VIEATATAPDAPADGPDQVSHVWRIVLFVVSVQLAVIALGMLLFSAMGLANDGTGSCGGL
jgi:hypothetical protein